MIGSVVGLIDWLIICWHPAIPNWFAAGSRTAPRRHTTLFSGIAAVCAFGLTWMAMTGLQLWPTPYTQLFWGSVASIVAFTAILLITRHIHKPKNLARGELPEMPDGIDKFLPFAVRILLTLTLSIILGFGLSVVINSEAIQEGRSILSVESTLNSLRAKAEEAYRIDLANYEKEVESIKAANEKRDKELQRLSEQLQEARKARIEAEQNYNKALEQLNCERDALCSGSKIGRAHV